jgi:hypothetical protein
VIELLQRADGAAIIDLTHATGWLPHTTRAALTGLRKRGYAVIRERVGAGASVYRISDAHLTGEIVPYRSATRWMTAGPSRRRQKRRSRMTRAGANSGRAANRPMAPTPGASLPLDASLIRYEIRRRLVVRLFPKGKLAIW